MSSKKGSRLERELMQMFYDAGYGVVRSAGSGVSRYPAPDIIVGNGKKILAVECKASKSSTVYIEPEQVEGLLEFSKKFGAQALIGVRFNYEDWRFLPPEGLERTEGQKYKVSRAAAEKSGKSFSAVAS
ncbi:MAG: Holliday junction resolvase Hjc [archaeon]